MIGKKKPRNDMAVSLQGIAESGIELNDSNYDSVYHIKTKEIKSGYQFIATANPQDFYMGDEPEELRYCSPIVGHLDAAEIERYLDNGYNAIARRIDDDSN